MDIQIMPHSLKGSISAIPSKSDAHRALFAASLANGPSTIYLDRLSKDLEATLTCIEGLGCLVHHDSDQKAYHILPDAHSMKRHFNVGESGTSLRFLIPILASRLEKNQQVEILRQGSLINRTNQPYWDLFDQLGIYWQEEGPSIWLSGKLEAGNYQLPGNVSSQFISGLALALAHLNKASQIKLTSPLESAAYVDMTLASLKEFSKRIDFSHQTQAYHLLAGPIQAAPYQVEGDWSNALFFLVAGVQVLNLTFDSLQADRQALSYLDKLGYPIPEPAKQSTDYHPSKTSTASNQIVEIDARQLPDAIPILTLAAARKAGITRIVNGQRLRLKESDRIESTVALMQALGVYIQAEADGFILQGGQGFHGGIVDTFQDHRIAMTAAIAGSFAQEPVIIKGADCVSKSYPHFFDDFQKLGGIYHVL
ncbi:3-phosphoshikimate 1-carboxyvinyltransferase [Facklamia sp. P13064]|uniref:3-phosphoshikimate 1-carboxyvinyltransferase n=1 Tax=Facklamia sp. P13064 TaxID=3421953 RepID=UPI003D167896